MSQQSPGSDRHRWHRWQWHTGGGRHREGPRRVHGERPQCLGRQPLGHAALAATRLVPREPPRRRRRDPPSARHPRRHRRRSPAARCRRREAPGQGGGRPLSPGPSREWSQSRVASLLEQGRSGIAHPVWGWKEPNSHVYVELIGEHFGRPRYVHVIRNGLDMAYSSNQWQLRTWGWLYGVSAIPPISEGSPATSLEYWIRANKAAIENRRKMSRGPVPAGQLRRTVRPSRARGGPPCHVRRDPTCRQRTSPGWRTSRSGAGSSGRWRRHGPSAFSQQQLEEVAALGFAVQ